MGLLGVVKVIPEIVESYIVANFFLNLSRHFNQELRDILNILDILNFI